MSRLIQAFAVAMILLGVIATRARADLSITVGSGTVAPGGIGTVDIDVTSYTGNTLSAFDLALQITPISATSTLQFTSNPPDPPQPDPYGNANYVFYNQSLYQDLSLPFWAVPSPGNVPSPFVSIIGGDVNDGSTLGYVSIPSTPGGAYTYLATVQFKAPTGATPGDTFQISLVSGTDFYAQNSNLLNYTSTPGTVTVAGGLAAVPEPFSSTMVVLSGLCGLLWCCWRRGRKHGQQKLESRLQPFLSA